MAGGAGAHERSVCPQVSRGTRGRRSGATRFRGRVRTVRTSRARHRNTEPLGDRPSFDIRSLLFRSFSFSSRLSSAGSLGGPIRANTSRPMMHSSMHAPSRSVPKSMARSLTCLSSTISWSRRVPCSCASTSGTTGRPLTRRRPRSTRRKAASPISTRRSRPAGENRSSRKASNGGAGRVDLRTRGRHARSATAQEEEQAPSSGRNRPPPISGSGRPPSMPRRPMLLRRRNRSPCCTRSERLRKDSLSRRRRPCRGQSGAHRDQGAHRRADRQAHGCERRLRPNRAKPDDVRPA